MLTHRLGMDAERTLNDTVVDIRLGVEFPTERQSEIFYLANRQGKCRREMSQHAMHSINGNLPNTEVAQHMVHAQGIKILLHVMETAAEP